MLLCHTLSLRVCSISHSLIQWCYLIISSSANPIFLLPSVFLSIRVFPESQLFASGSQTIGVSVQLILRVNFLWGCTGLISLQPKGLSRIFSSTTAWKHQFFATQPSLGSNSPIHYMINKQGDTIQSCGTPFQNLKQSIVPYLVLFLLDPHAGFPEDRQGSLVFLSL